MYCPEGWGILNDEVWHLPDNEARAFWFALSRAQNVRPVTLCQQIQPVGHVRVTDDLLQRICVPAVILAALEDLWREGHLRRMQCTRIEENILRHVQPHGRWRGDPTPGVVQPTTHAPDVVSLAQVGRR
jgi:hypothetical protein